jgi:uncharacterized protein YkwD
MNPLSRLLAVACLFAAASFAVTAPAFARGPSGHKMLRAINEARAQHGLEQVRAGRGLARGARRHALTMARQSRFQHASGLRAAEILGLAPRGVGSRGIVRAWLRSPVHRPILLGPRYGRVGVGAARGRTSGGMRTFWVVRFRLR